MITIFVLAALAALYVLDRTALRVIRQRVAARKHVADLQWRMSKYSYTARDSA